jgi:hypothetical protein
MREFHLKRSWGPKLLRVQRKSQNFPPTNPKPNHLKFHLHVTKIKHVRKKWLNLFFPLFFIHIVPRSGKTTIHHTEAKKRHQKLFKSTFSSAINCFGNYLFGVEFEGCSLILFQIKKSFNLRGNSADPKLHNLRTLPYLEFVLFYYFSHFIFDLLCGWMSVVRLACSVNFDRESLIF